MAKKSFRKRGEKVYNKNGKTAERSDEAEQYEYAEHNTILYNEDQTE